MSKGNKKHKPAVNPSNPDSLRELDKDTLVGMVCRLYEQNRQITELMQTLVREKYGKKTEQFIDSNQLTLFDTDAIEKPTKDSSSTNSAAEEKPKQPRNRDRNPRQCNLKRVKIRVKELCPEDLICKCCGRPRVKVGEIVVHSQRDFQPATVTRRDLVEEVFACSECDGALVSGAELAESIFDEGGEFSTDPAEQAMAAELVKWLNVNEQIQQLDNDSNQQILDDAVAIGRAKMRRAVATVVRCQATPAMLSYVAISKYCDHLPLYRLEQVFARYSAHVARSTMCDWLAILAILLRPLYDLMHEKLLESKIIWTDDTPVKVQLRKAKIKIRTGRIWIYMGDDEHPFNVFHYTPGRAREGPTKFLKGFKRFLQGDCFSGNTAICAENGATLVACNAHARRYFIKAILNFKSKSEEALRFFAQLFEVDRTARELALSPEDTKLMREQEAKPVMAKFKAWLDQEHLLALPKSAFGKAVAYCLNNWDALNAYLLDGSLTIDNNAAERQMKNVAVGRKAWLFFGSDNGGENAEVLLSIISTCKRHNVEPGAYLRDVIETLIKDPDIDLNTLLPHTWNLRPGKVSIAA